MRPPPPAFMALYAGCTTRIVPRRFTSMMSSKSAIVISSNGVSRTMAAFATLGPDLLDDRLGQAGVLAAPERVATEVVHHDPRAAAGELDGVAAAHATAGPGHDDDVAVEVERAHSLSPRLVHGPWHPVSPK